ncbi:MAG TPA: galactokinase [Thermoanaerobaculales bacterium]|nr:galactokinase [Thermoanaerobaculales bacterium]
MTGPGWQARLRERHAALFGAGAQPLVAVAPGRVNLIGEHTDYNDGWVLPMAIDRCAGVAAAPRADRTLRAHATVFSETREVAIDELQPPGGGHWLSYVAGVAWAMRAAGLEVPGADLVLDGDVPLGSGLSSSAAVEMAVARALCALAGAPWEPLAMARLGQRVEGEFVGVKGGMMDQYTAVFGRAGHALLLDCRTLEAEPVPLPEAAVVVVMDTGAPCSLAGSAYNDRSRSCRLAVEAIRTLAPEVRALRDVDEGLLEVARGRMGEVELKRARHVVAESRRPLAMAEALRRGDLAAAGRLMNDSHASLRELYEVSSAELDLFTELARRHPACHGARLTGAGFGGCAIALVEAGGAEAFMVEVHAGYRERFDLPSAVFVCRPSSGARLLNG